MVIFHSYVSLPEGNDLAVSMLKATVWCFWQSDKALYCMVSKNDVRQWSNGRVRQSQSQGVNGAFCGWRRTDDAIPYGCPWAGPASPGHAAPPSSRDSASTSVPVLDLTWVVNSHLVGQLDSPPKNENNLWFQSHRSDKNRCLPWNRND